MRFRLVPIMILITIAAWVLGASVEPPQPVTWWTAYPLAKVRPFDPVPNAPAKSVDLYAGRNEFEPFQIVLR